MRQRIKNIAESIIKDSFPLLKGKSIVYLVFYLRFYAFSVWVPPFFRLITVSTRARNFDDFTLTGVIAHELCHQERYINMGLKRYLKFICMYTFSGKTRFDEERATDMLTIEKGYARQLYDLTLISSNDSAHKPIIDNYLSPEEIRSFAEEAGIW